ncbi:MAG: ABC transporter ATP-binding protein [Patescibacteria group bacterium]|nr:ABC transporter ATP-binding protein/permease [Patescibacteria group bacterium]MDE1945777.1 ABC transporter ATP-binding protein [Patescibacteria group bacterium]
MQSKEQNSNIKTGMRAIMRHARAFKRQLIFLGVFGFISAIANGSVPYITGRFFDSLIAVSKHENVMAAGMPRWAFLLGLWALIELVAYNIDWFSDRFRRGIDTDIHLKIQADGFKHLLKLPLSYHKNAHVNGDLQKLSSAGWRVSSIIRTVISIVPQFLSILIGIILAATISPFLAGILVLGVVLYCFLLSRILKPAAAMDMRAHEAWNGGWDDAAQAVHNVESVKQSVAEDYETKKIDANLMGKASALWAKVEMIWSNVGFFQRMIVFCVQLLIFFFSVSMVAAGTLSIGDLIALNGYSGMFFGPFVMLGYNWQIIQNGIVSAAKAEEIFREPEETYAPNASVSKDRLAGDIVFDDVCFRYGAGQPEVLSHIAFSAKPGQIIALVGESGVGKSTLVHLISGYYFPTIGQVLVDGIATKDWNLSSLRRNIAVVPQEVALFNDTLRANIAYGSFNVSDADIERVAHDAHLGEFIDTLPDKYASIVGERGIKLSVGQKQRVSIARAMLRDPAVLILDEPTSALDAHTEKIITGSLEKLMEGRTTFVIAHRLSTVRTADIIIVLEKGRIAETGTHAELIQKGNGVYRRLYEYQIGLH